VPIRRDRKTGKIRDLKEEREEERKKEEILKEHKAKYAIWGKGYLINFHIINIIDGNINQVLNILKLLFKKV